MTRTSSASSSRRARKERDVVRARLTVLEVAILARRDKCGITVNLNSALQATERLRGGLSASLWERTDPRSSLVFRLMFVDFRRCEHGSRGPFRRPQGQQEGHPQGAPRRERPESSTVLACRRRRGGDAETFSRLFGNGSRSVSRRALVCQAAVGGDALASEAMDSSASATISWSSVHDPSPRPLSAPARRSISPRASAVNFIPGSE